MAPSSRQRHPDDITHYLLPAFAALVGISVVAVLIWLVTDPQASSSRLLMDNAQQRIV